MKEFSRHVFTARQQQILQTIKPGYPVNDIRLLRKLSKLGMVTLHAQTGLIVRHVWGTWSALFISKMPKPLRLKV
ncbi:hypothetical protein [Alistipes sp.]|uniref:hypothetical protein n=1 Tax=Alistipes sp. TaxID=1872444 RepID=UPI003AF8BA4C